MHAIPELHDLQRLFGTLRAELESHVETEERVLFPLCRAAEANGTPVDEGLLVQREHEHASSGDALAALRELACDYDTSHALCRTHRTLLESLRALEFDLHQHIHEENNVLFPRAGTESRATGRERGPAHPLRWVEPPRP